MDEKKEEKVIWAGKTSCSCGCGPGCACGYGHGPYGNGYGGGYGWHRGPHVIGWIIGIVILFCAFFFGIAIGRFSDHLHAEYGGYYRQYPMMQGYYYGGYGAPAQTPAGQPVNGATTTSPVNGQ